MTLGLMPWGYLFINNIIMQFVLHYQIARKNVTSYFLNIPYAIGRNYNKEYYHNENLTLIL